MRRQTALVVLLLLAAAAAGFGVYAWLAPGAATTDTAATAPPPPTPPVMTVSQAMDASFDNLEGGPARKLSDWHGKTLLVNFWATWCGPCREEMPLLVKLQAEYGGQGLQIVGIAADETDQGKVKDFLEHMVVNYPMLMGDEDLGSLVAGLGGNLVGLPYTVLLDRDGHVLKLHAGELHPDEAEQLIQTALARPATPAAPAATAASPTKAATPAN
jgi:thiol-disulfide isomerase/thioredoxin